MAVEPTDVAEIDTEAETVEVTEPTAPPEKVAREQATSDTAIRVQGTARKVRTMEERLDGLERDLAEVLGEKMGFQWPPE